MSDSWRLELQFGSGVLSVRALLGTAMRRRAASSLILSAELTQSRLRGSADLYFDLGGLLLDIFNVWVIKTSRLADSVLVVTLI